MLRRASRLVRGRSIFVGLLGRLCLFFWVSLGEGRKWGGEWTYRHQGRGRRRIDGFLEELERGQRL